MITRTVLICFLFLTSTLSSLSQELNKLVDKVVEGTQVSEILIPLSEMQELAAQNSPLLKYYNSDIIINELQIKAQKREWMSTLSLDASVKYGLYDNLVIYEDLDSESTTSTTEQTRYSVGISLSIPLNTFADRSSVKQAKAELEKVKNQRESSIQELRKLVIIQYNNVLKSNMNLKVRNKSYEMFKLQLIRSEKDFVNGKINISEYSRVHDTTVNAELEFENLKIELRTAIQILNEIVGAQVTL
jgi:outer membrane protein TolC